MGEAAVERSNKTPEAASAPPTRSSTPARAGVTDLRPAAGAQVQLVDMVNASARVAQLQSMQSMANAAAPAASAGGLDPQLRSGIEALSGVSMAGVQVHRNSSRPAQLQAHAYAQGEHIHLAPGQERHLPHEAWHVVQQKQGRVRATTQRKGIGVNADAALEREADQMGQAARRHQGGPVVAQAVAAPAGTPVQRVKIPFAHTDGSAYDPDEHKDQKAIEMARFAGLPGRTTKAVDFTWHHIVPQSHLKDRNLARSQMMIRLGPSTSYRLDDPGNDYTDPNFKRDGTHTPFSEAVEGAFAPSAKPGVKAPPKLDHALLASKLADLVAQQKNPSANQYSDPGQWHLALADLQSAQGLTAAEKKTLAGLAKPTHFSVKGVARKEDAIAWSELHEDKIHKDLWAKMHAHLSRDPKTYDAHQFFRGHQELDKINIMRFHLLKPMQAQVLLEAEQAIDNDKTLHGLIQANGKIIVFLRDAKTLAGNVATAVSELAKSQGLGKFQGVQHEYYLGSDATTVDAGALGRANTVRTSLHEHGIGEDVALAHTFKGTHVAKASQTDRVELSAAESVVAPSGASVEDLFAIVQSEYSIAGPFTKTGVGKLTEKGAISSEAERTRLVSLIRSLKGAKKKGPINQEIGDLIGAVKSRGSDLEGFAHTEAQRRFEDHNAPLRAAALSERRLAKFKEKQSHKIAKLNDLTAHLPRYVNESGAVDAQHMVRHLSNFEFLKKYWPELNSNLMPALKAQLARLELARPVEVPNQEPDFTASVEQYKVDAHKLIATALAAWAVELGKFITAQGAALKAAKADIRVADAVLAPSEVPAMDAPKPTIAPAKFKPIVADSPSAEPSKKDKSASEASPLLLALEHILAQALHNLVAPQQFLVDHEGGILPASADTFVAAYRADLANSNAYLTEGEAHTIASHLGIRLNVFRNAAPEGYEPVQNDGGGNCLIHSIFQAQRQSQGVPPTQATGSEIRNARLQVAAGIDRDTIIALSGAAVAAQMAGQPEHGLGPRMRALVYAANVHALFNKSGEKAKPHVPSEQSKPQGGGGGAVAMPQVGAGQLLAGVALLHTGGNHWVMIRALPQAAEAVSD